MKNTRLLFCFMSLLLVSLLGCREKPEMCTHEGYHLPKYIWNDYYPYVEGQKVVFKNDQDETLVFEARLVNAPEHDDEYYTYEYICGQIGNPMTYTVGLKAMDADCKYEISLSEFGEGKEDALAKFYVNINNTSMFKYTFEGNVANLESSLGDTIPYQITMGDGCNQNSVCHVKGEGLVSFYDSEKQCIWHLAE